MRKVIKRLGQSWQRRRFIYFLILLLLFITFAPLLQTSADLNVFIDISFSAILVCTIYAGSRKKYQAPVAYLLALPMILPVLFTTVLSRLRQWAAVLSKLSATWRYPLPLWNPFWASFIWSFYCSLAGRHEFRKKVKVITIHFSEKVGIAAADGRNKILEVR
jgi:hypothetical protein